MTKEKKSKEQTTNDFQNPPQTLAEAEAYLSKPSTRQILDFYAESPYLYETAWAYHSVDQRLMSDMVNHDDEGRPEDLLRALPAEDVLEIHDVLNVEQHDPGVIQWDELKNGEVEEEQGDHWVTAQDIRLMSKFYNKSSISENLWAQAILGLKKSIVGLLFAKARNKDKARQRRLKRKMARRGSMKREGLGSGLPKQDDLLKRMESGGGAEGTPEIELARTVSNVSDSINKKRQHRAKRHQAEQETSESRGRNKSRRAKKRKIETGATESVTNKPLYIPPAQTEIGNRQVDFEQEETRSATKQQKDYIADSLPVVRKPSCEVEDTNSTGKKRKRRHENTNTKEHDSVDETSSNIIPPTIEEKGQDEDATNKGTSQISHQNDNDRGEHNKEDDDQSNDHQQNDDEQRETQQDSRHEGGVLLPSSPLEAAQTSSSTTAPSTPLLQSTTIPPRTTRSSARKSPLKSPYFASLSTTSTASSPRRTPKGTSSIPFPPLSAASFGLIQESLAQNPYYLLIAVQFLNKTRGSIAIPVIYKLLELYPTPDDLAIADPAVIVPVIRHLGLQNQRAKKLVDFAQMWIACPPERGQRYRRLDYPSKGVGKDIKKDEVIADEEDDPRQGAWEVAHLPGVGAYAIDSWRIFCRDVLRGVAKGWDGGGAITSSTTDMKKEASINEKEEVDNDHDRQIADTTARSFQPEWERTLPLDKELRAFLRWKWLKKYRLSWNPLTGKTTPASKDLLKKVEAGGCIVEELGADSDVVVEALEGGTRKENSTEAEVKDDDENIAADTYKNADEHQGSSEI